MTQAGHASRADGDAHEHDELDDLDRDILNHVASGEPSFVGLIGNPPSRSTVYRRKGDLVRRGYLTLDGDRARLTAKGEEARGRAAAAEPVPASADLRAHVLPLVPATPLDAEEAEAWSRLRETVRTLKVDPDDAMRVLTDHVEARKPVERLRKEERRRKANVAALKRQEAEAEEAVLGAVVKGQLTVEYVRTLNYVFERVSTHGRVDEARLARWVEVQKRLEEKGVDEPLIDAVATEVAAHEGDTEAAFGTLLEHTPCPRALTQSHGIVLLLGEGGAFAGRSPPDGRRAKVPRLRAQQEPPAGTIRVASGRLPFEGDDLQAMRSSVVRPVPQVRRA